MSNSVETGMETNTGGVEAIACPSTRVSILEIPGVKIPILFQQYLQAVDQTNANSTKPRTATQGGVVVVQPPPTVNFPKLCRDFANLGRKPYVRTKPYAVTRTWLNTCEKIFNLLGLSDSTRRQLAT